MKTNKDLATYFVNGRYGHGSNCHTDGTTFVSYDTAVAVNHGKCILIACAYKARNWCGSFFGRTATTERQLLHVKRAAKTYFIVPCIFPQDRHDHRENLKFLRAEAKECREKAKRARLEEMRTYWVERAKEKTKTANRYYKLFL